MSKQLKPQIRFKGFEDECHRETLKDLARVNLELDFTKKNKAVK